MILECSRCGDRYNNDEARSQEEADSKLDVCDRCYEYLIEERESNELRQDS